MRFKISLTWFHNTLKGHKHVKSWKVLITWMKQAWIKPFQLTLLKEEPKYFLASKLKDFKKRLRERRTLYLYVSSKCLLDRYDLNDIHNSQETD